MQYTCCVEGGDFFGGKQKVTVAAASAAELADFVVARCGVDSACKLMCRRDESELYTALETAEFKFQFEKNQIRSSNIYIGAF